MVSRRSRTPTPQEYQPQPSLNTVRSLSPGIYQQASFEMQQQRSQSSMRPRQPSRMMAYSNSQRPLSTGRVRAQPALVPWPLEDPDEVARAILDMRSQREKRSRSSSRDRNAHTMPKVPVSGRSTPISGRSTPLSTQNGSVRYPQPLEPPQQQQLLRTQSQVSAASSQENHNPEIMVDEEVQPVPAAVVTTAYPMTPRSQEEERARASLRNAENRIENLLHELEELRFFQEIDEAEPSPPQKRLGAMRSTKTPRQQHVLPMPNADPRRISKMDRTSLELEVQTVIRQVQVLMQEKTALESEVEMYKVSMQDKSEANARVKQLENHLRQVSEQLRSAKNDMEEMHEQLVANFEDRLKEKSHELLKARAIADQYKAERDKARESFDKRKAEYAEKKQKWKDDFRQHREEAQAREAVLELQLGEATDLIEAMRKECEDKTLALDTLKQELENAGKSMAEIKESKDEAHEIQLSSMQEELALIRDKYTRTESEKRQLEEQLSSLTKKLETTQRENEDHVALIKDMTERLDSVHAEYRGKFGELKEVYEAKEKRRLNEMVLAQSSEVEEYERRIKSLQEQLTLATDRHHAEIRQKDMEIEAKLQRHEAIVRAQVEQEQGGLVYSLKQELESLRQEYELAESERRHYKAEAESPRADAKAREEAWEYQDILREKEISRLREKQQSLEREIADKDGRIKELSSRMNERESRHLSRVNQLESQRAEELISRDEALAAQKRENRVIETKLHSTIADYESDLGELRALMDARVLELQTELQRVQSALTEARQELDGSEGSKDKVDELRVALEKVQNELSIERTAHESCVAEMRVEIAKLEGKLRAGESSLKQKRALIEELEEQLRQKENTSCSDEFGPHVEALQREINALRQDLESERDAIRKKDEQITELRQVQGSLVSKTEGLKEAENTILELQELLSKTQDDKMQAIGELTKLREDFEHVTARLAEYEQTIESQGSMEKDNSEKFSASLESLQAELKVERQSKKELIEKLQDVEADLELKEAQLRRLPKLQEQLKELISGREDLQEQLGNIESDLIRKDKQLKQAADLHAKEMESLRKDLESEKAAKDAIEAKLRDVEDEIKLSTERMERFERQIPEIKADLTEKIEANEELKAQLARANGELQRLKGHIGEVAGQSDFSVEMQSKVEQLTKTKVVLEAKIRDLEEEREDREKQIRETSERYSNQIVDLQMQVEDLSRAKSSIAQRLSQAESDLEEKELQISQTSSQFSGDINELHAKLAQQLVEKSRLEEKLRSLEELFAQKKKDEDVIASKLSDEMKSRYESESKENRSLRLKIGDIHAELERKETQIKDVVSRYSQEISDLRDKLEDESRANTLLRKEVEQLKSDSNSISSSSIEASTLRERLVSLEKALEVERALARDTDKTKKSLEDKLATAESSRSELEEKFEKCNSERTEVITALEELIKEVQSREEEIESLVAILRKRDEELEHAKLIATKALSSAQELKNRYKGRDGERQAELAEKVNELNKSLEFITKKNENLQKRTSKLEEELTAREGECEELRAKLNKLNGTSQSSYDKLDHYVSLSNGKEEEEVYGDSPVATNEFNDPESPAHSLASGTTASSSQSDNGGSGWLANFDSMPTDDASDAESQVSFAGIRTDPGVGGDVHSRRALERDALRKYVRKRYLKSKGSL